MTSTWVQQIVLLLLAGVSGQFDFSKSVDSGLLALLEDI